MGQSDRGLFSIEVLFKTTLACVKLAKKKITGLLCKCEAPNSNPQSPQKTRGGVGKPSAPMQRWEVERVESLEGHSSAKLL